MQDAQYQRGALHRSIAQLARDSKSSPNVGRKQFAEFNLAGRTFVVTGGAQGLGLTLAEGLVEAGGNVHCLDCAEKPSEKWLEARSRVVPEWGGALRYSQVDVTDTDNLNHVIGSIANEGNGIHGVIAAAGIQQLTPAVDYTAEDVQKMLSVNYTGVFMTATAVAREMIRHNCRGSVCLIGSISGTIANRGLIAPAYNSSKAAVVQLARNLAMEWAEHGIRVNTLSPGHMLTPMVQKNFEDRPELKDIWNKEIMLGRLADPDEFKGAALFLLSNASSFVTGSNLIVDGGHTAW
ncbi:enoyl-(Acyl carrier protein) reductase domain-containing protein [Sarocladium implicatum]|nr:enoyl-(Acyl carrier protein) reductase domain-containing protein [Sarocladium implicatum]